MGTDRRGFHVPILGFVAVQSWEVASDLEPLDVRDLMCHERAALITLLRDLEPETWASPTACPGWDVRDIALHLLGSDAARLSSRRDGYGAGSAPDLEYAAIARLIDEENDLWVRAGRRLSPRVVIGLLGFLGEELDAYLRDLDLWEEGSSVAWSGVGATPNWLDVAREYTERWVHHQQIREAARRPGLLERKWLHPVLDTFMRCLPRAYDAEEAPLGTSILITVEGPPMGDSPRGGAMATRCALAGHSIGRGIAGRGPRLATAGPNNPTARGA